MRISDWSSDVCSSDLLIDADPQGSALDWSQQRATEGLPRLFSVVGLARDTLHIEAHELARGMDHVVIDGPPRVANLLRSALFACDLALIPVQPSPLDGWASAEMLKLIDPARHFKPEIGARFLLDRYPARTLTARAPAESLAGPHPPRPAHHATGRWPVGARGGENG